MPDSINKARRHLIFGIMTLPASAIATGYLSTPRASEGPYYPTTDMRYGDIDNDLVKISDRAKQAGGEVVDLAGRVFEPGGNPLPSARVEIWQCDANGRYLHRADYGAMTSDRSFQGFGYNITDSGGNYFFRTIKPVPYGGRAPHIHLKVWVKGRDRLTTQLYLPDHPGNARDWLYRRIPENKRDLVTMRFKETGREPLAIVDLVV